MAETTATTMAPEDIKAIIAAAPPEAVHKLRRARTNAQYRCSNPHCKAYPSYGGRGITMCPEWTSNGDAFVAWALLNGWAPGLTLDRVDNDGPYAPSNCRWTTMRQQGYNRRDNVRVTVRGDTYTITEWANIIGVASAAITNARRNGTPPEEYIAAHLDAGYGVRVRLHPRRTNNISAAH